MGAPPLLQLTGVRRSYGKRTVLHPVDLSLDGGQCVALLGHNGSGKSTLLRIAAGRDKPTKGKVTFDGRPMSENDARVRARVAVVGDTVACYPDLTVRQHLQLVAVAHGVEGADAWIDHVLADRLLSEHAASLPSGLSSGQLQSLLLASALVRPRDLLLLDEPEQRLDPDARRRLADLITAEVADGVGVLLVTHHAELARAVADRVLVLREGKLIADGTPDEVLSDDVTDTSWQTGAAGAAR
ncbi:ABC transporter ATP-binding protein [Streptomyces sp. NPDC006733]|uniref:ABC transporter ATP-binding protein n=1 Tax=Streptomyces sp. NPDC006733 TaxID=3155460 RepID=UPI0033D974A8